MCFGLTTSICVPEGRNGLACYSEFVFERPWPQISVLKLYDSFLTQSTALSVFANVKDIYVFGDYSAQTCSELYELYRLHGCQSMSTPFWSTTEDMQTTADIQTTTDPLTTAGLYTTPSIKPFTLKTSSVTPDPTIHTSTQPVTPEPVSPEPSDQAQHFKTVYIVIIAVCSTLTVAVTITVTVRFARRRRMRNLTQRSLFSVDSEESDDLENSPPVHQGVALQMDSLPLPSAPTHSPGDSRNTSRSQVRRDPERVALLATPRTHQVRVHHTPSTSQIQRPPLAQSTPHPMLLQFFKSGDDDVIDNPDNSAECSNTQDLDEVILHRSDENTQGLREDSGYVPARQNARQHRIDTLDTTIIAASDIAASKQVSTGNTLGDQMKTSKTVRDASVATQLPRAPSYDTTDKDKPDQQGADAPGDVTADTSELPGADAPGDVTADRNKLPGSDAPGDVTADRSKLPGADASRDVIADQSKLQDVDEPGDVTAGRQKLHDPGASDDVTKITGHDASGYVTPDSSQQETHGSTSLNTSSSEASTAHATIVQAPGNVSINLEKDLRRSERNKQPPNRYGDWV